VIAGVTISVGGPATPALPAMVLLDDSTFYIDLSIDEIDIGLIQEGQPARLTLDAYPDLPLSGIVDRIGLLPQTGSVSVAYPVRVALAEETT
jgi:HlyD family secretion protein